jgi:hypothetical protein
MSMVGFPLLLIPLAIYNIIAFLMPDVRFDVPLVRVPLVSREVWAVSLGDMLVTLSVLLLLLEVIKAARGKYLTDHLLSLLVFGAAAAEFVMWPKFASTTFFLLALLAMVEFISGIALRVKRAPRARAVATAPVAVAPEPAPAAETHVEATPVPVAPAPVVTEPAAAEPAAVPPATSVAESVLSEHSAPHPAPVASEPHHQVEASGLQHATITPPEPPSQVDETKP